MDAFEQVISMLLRREGWWTRTSFKVELSKPEKASIGRPSSPRWELDVLAYKGSTNEVLAVECKSFLDSPGVHFVAGKLHPPERYKLFSDPKLRRVVLKRLGTQLVEAGACAPEPSIQLGLAAGKLRLPQRSTEAATSAELALRAAFDQQGWWLWTPRDISNRLKACAGAGYENDTAYVVAKLLGRSAEGREAVGRSK